jgi:hypothetical protein
MNHTRFGVIDIGYKTVDIFAAEGLEPVDDSNINIVVPNDPQFANARGYFKLGYVLRGEFERDGEKGA